MFARALIKRRDDFTAYLKLCWLEINLFQGITGHFNTWLGGVYVWGGGVYVGVWVEGWVCVCVCVCGGVCVCVKIGKID